jgi:phosphomannomutase
LKNDFTEIGYQTVTIDGVKVLEPEGWFLIRASNTQPQIRLTVEAKTQEKLEELKSIADKAIRKKIKYFESRT